MAALSKVLIVGGGFAGMSCAIQMRKAGLQVDLIEVEPHWGIYGAGITMTGPTLRALRTLGVLDPVLAVAATWHGAKVHDKLGNLLEDVTFPALAEGLPASGGIHTTIVVGSAQSPLAKDKIEVRLMGTSTGGDGSFRYLYNVQPLQGRQCAGHFRGEMA